ncbi:MAG TPA: phage tail tape measure protein [Nitriliruptorales bacterium]
MPGPVYGSGFVSLAPQLGPKFGAGILGAMGPIGVAAGAALAAGIGGAVALEKVGAGFDAAFDKIIVGTGASGDALEGLKTEFRDVFASVPTDMDSAATAVADLNTRLGLTGDPLEEMSRRMLNLSRLTETDLGGNIANVTRVFGDWGIEAADQPEALDKIFEATKRTGIGLDTLTGNVVKFGAPLRQLGFGFEESLAIFGKWEKEGVNTEVVLGGVRQAIGKLAKAGEEPSEAFFRLSDEIKTAGTEGEATRKAIELFGQRAGPDMAAAIREGRFELGDLVAGLEGSAGALDDAVDRTDSWRQSWQKLKNKGLLAIEPVAVRFFNFLGTAFDAVGPVVGAVSGAISGFFGLFKGGEGVADGPVGSIVGALEGIRPTIAAVVGALRGGWDAIGAIFKVGVKIVTGFWDRFGTHIVEFLKQTVANVMQTFEGVFRAITGVFDVFAGIFTGDWSRVWGGIQQIVSGIWSAILGVIKQALNVARTVIGGAIAAISQLWSFGWNAIKTFLVGIWSSITRGVSSAFADLIAWFRALPGRIIDAVSDLDLTGKMFEFGQDLIDGLIGGVKSMTKKLGNAVTGVIYDNTAGKLKKVLGISSPSRVFAGIGADSVAGLIAGIQDNKSSLARAAASLASIASAGAGSHRRLLAAAGRISDAGDGRDGPARGMFGDVTITGVPTPTDTAWELRKLALEMA